MVRCAALVSTLCLALCQAAAAQEGRDISIRGKVVYLGLDALPRGSRIHIYLKDTTIRANPEIVAEKTFLTEGHQIPIKFSLSARQTAIRPRRRYSACADISILERRVFDCDKPVTFMGLRVPKVITLKLRRLP
jgi:uncharacterized lipoprotein YbaY